MRNRLASRPHLTTLQADDVDAGRQQHGDAYGDNDQEEFSHGVPRLCGPNALWNEWFSARWR
jgi:hypothetical protein